MNQEKIQDIEKLIISADDIAETLSIRRPSAQVTASRYTNSGKLIRLKRDTYILPQRLKVLNEEELFTLATYLQPQSYVSLTTALSFYELSTQQQRNFIESIGLKRTTTFQVRDIEFTFTKVKKEFYSGFKRKDDFFIALPEKALADIIYLTSMGNYSADFDAVDFSKFNKREVERILSKSNKAAINLWQKLIRNYAI